MDTHSHLTEACNITRQAQGLPIHPYLLSKRPSHSGNKVDVELDSDFEGHLDDSIDLFSDTPKSPEHSEHTGCTVTIECPDLTEDEVEYKSASSSDEETDSEPTKPKDLGKPFRKVVRQARGGRNRLRRGGSDEKITGLIRLTEYLSYKASDSDTPSYSLLVTAKTPTPAIVKKIGPNQWVGYWGQYQPPSSLASMPAWGRS